MDMKVQHPSYRIVSEGGTGEITVKKSRFIATLRPVNTMEEATAFFEAVKKQYWDARHNCSACVIGAGKEITRCSDDGEPSGTAGKPMLEVLLGEDITNTAVVVTRYFGGTLLGTGGLVKAYTQAVKEGLAASVLAVMEYGQNIKLSMEYSEVGKIQYILGKNEILINESYYGERVEMSAFIPIYSIDRVKKELIEATGAEIQIDIISTGYHNRRR